MTWNARRVEGDELGKGVVSGNEEEIVLSRIQRDIPYTHFDFGNAAARLCIGLPLLRVARLILLPSLLVVANGELNLRDVDDDFLIEINAQLPSSHCHPAFAL